MSIKHLSFATLTLATLTAALPTLADQGPYIGAQYAVTEYEQSGTAASDGDAKPTALVLSAGYSFSKHVALEGRLGFNASDDELFAATTTTVQTNVELDQLVSVLGKFSLGGSVSPYVLLGFSDVELEATGGQTTSSDDVSFGVGVDFSITDNAAISLEYIDYADGDIVGGGTAEFTAASLGFNYKF